jgi:hypothetical protein
MRGPFYFLCVIALTARSSFVIRIKGDAARGAREQFRLPGTPARDTPRLHVFRCHTERKCGDARQSCACGERHGHAEERRVYLL